MLWLQGHMVSDPGRGASGNSMLCLPHPLPRRVVQEAAQVLSFPLKNLVRIRVDPALLGSIGVHYRFFLFSMLTIEKQCQRPNFGHSK